MKKAFFLGAALVATLTAGAQQADYKPVLTNTFTAFDTTWNDQQTKLELSNKLTLIAKKYPEAWITQYYAAYSKVQLSYNDKLDAAKRDAYIDEAEILRDEAVHLLGKNNDETYVLSAMIANARLGVDGRARWQKYGKIFEENLDNAKSINADNPRIYILKGISKYFMPKMFGGGAKAALPYFEKAQGLLAKESKEDVNKPYWGTQTNEYFLKMANGGDKE
jgi:hypothetical protein